MKKYTTYHPKRETILTRTQEEIDLTLGYIRGDVTLKQIQKKIKLRNQVNVYVWLVNTCRILLKNK